MAITIKEIAKLSGVSRGTVDRVLNDRGQVSKVIKERILSIASEYNYTKNVLASRLASKKEITIAVVIPSAESDIFWQAPYRGISKMERAIADYGMSLKYFNFDLFDSKAYTKAFQKAIEYKPDSILVAPVFLKETLTYLKIAQQNNIPSVFINSEIEHEDVLCYIGQDSFQSGQLAGKLFNLNSTSNNEIIVLTMGHDSQNAIHIQKKIDGLKSYNTENNCNFKIHDIVIENFKNTEALNHVSNQILNTYSSIKGIFFTNSRAFHFLNNTSFLSNNKNDLRIVGFDLLPENIELLKEGKIDFLLNQNPEKQGYLGIVNLFHHFIYNKDIPPKQYLPIDIVLKENYLRYLEDSVQFLNLAL